MRIKVGVIFGGATVEHEVSIISAIQAIENINQEKYEVIPIYIDKDRQWYTGKLLTERCCIRALRTTAYGVLCQFCCECCSSAQMRIRTPHTGARIIRPA